MNARITSPAGLELIQSHEGLRLTAYLCPAGIWTIGWGHTGPDVHKGLTITRNEAYTLLRRDLEGPEEAINDHVTVLLDQSQFDALVSFVFNVGVKAFLGSTLLRKLNAGNYGAVPAELAKWNKGGGRVLPGLVRRRKEEAELWMAEAPDVDQEDTTRPDTVTAKPMLASRTVQGGIASGTGAAGMTIVETVQSVQPAVEGDGMIWLKVLFVLLICAGVGLTIWGRYRVAREEGV